ncbi:hypothetical protein [Aquimarina algicola]|uniref:Uncharacterized protein n=1 Tax=Aquimarina algicola TaxID=2589995 RepID=A0A504JIA4_9FLAO|nr:hypothetical protein [Aquimarina algicola]TPN86220.1 hypothetical protein FHK87_13195 [Aquimarina algicola]
MNVSVNDEKKIKNEEGKFKKIWAAVKKVISKEFLWMLFVLLASIPIALILEYVIKKDAGAFAEIEEVSQIITKEHPTFTVLYGLCVLGIYFSRMVAAAIKTQIENKK